jgi:formylglycine-generating enzyme required for sulfatase activity
MGACSEPSCDNGKIDGDEEGRDCGGSKCRKCEGKDCTDSSECKSRICFMNKCAPSGTKVCGVGVASLCKDGARCDLDADCETDYCGAGTTASTCGAPPADVHRDRRRNGGETGIDCGGTSMIECAANQGCKVDADCISTCNQTTKKCNVPSANDGKKNNGETDIDCGGPNAPKCKVTKACAKNSDCMLNTCSGNVCATPSISDGVKNGLETDIDCGGGTLTEDAITITAPRCRFEQACSASGDCRTPSVCSPEGKCQPPSCGTAEAAGIKTCGTGEPGQGNAVHENCCRSLTLPTRTTRALDKYEITAGRFRSFANAVGPNVRQWVSNFKAANPGTQLANLASPAVLQLYPGALRGQNLNFIAHMSLDIDNYNGIRGCYNGNGSSGHNTYWQEANNLTEYGIPARPLAREVTDAKSLNCAMPIMFAAFCAWDGGELATLADMQDAWGPSAYPWGATDIQRPNYNWCNGRRGTGGWMCQNTTLGDQGIFYQFPAGTDQTLDQSPLIAGPGRFPMDATARTSANGQRWYDLYGNVAEYTGDFQGASQEFCDFSGAPAAGATTCTRSLKPAGSIGTRYTGLPTTGIIGSSWEGHQYGRGQAVAFAVTFQYGKFGGRCVRPAQP